MPVLEIRNLSKHFGGLAAISDLTLNVQEGEILGLIGPNGAGKTTVFNMISGFGHPTNGKVIFKGEDITGLKPNVIAKKGIVRTFQATTLFDKFSVLTSVSVGLDPHTKGGFWGELFITPFTWRKKDALLRRKMEILEFMGLADAKDELAANLPYGYQRALGISIALATDPKMVLLDEPLTGMNREEALTIISAIKRTREERGNTVIVVEHNMRAVMSLSDRIAVLHHGRKIAEGSPEEIRINSEVIEAYLGATEGVA